MTKTCESEWSMSPASDGVAAWSVVLAKIQSALYMFFVFVFVVPRRSENRSTCSFFPSSACVFVLCVVYGFFLYVFFAHYVPCQ